ncbi:MAG TPA: phage tail protein [Actinomycetota bacterium]
MPDPFLVRTFRFQVSLTRSTPGTSAGDAGPQRLGDGGFQECSGLELEADIKDHLEGGRNDGVVRRVGRVKLHPLVLKRGMFAPTASGRAYTELWAWIQGMVAGVLPVPRFDGVIDVMDPTNTAPVATWAFVRGLPAKVSGPTLNAKTGDIAIEELQIAHEGLRLVTR